MKLSNNRVLKALVGVLTLSVMAVSQQSFACGGMFCDNIPINQAGEQIIFRQEGGETTAMIKIDYVGSAENFGWVLPVPQTPDISLGSDQTFTDLELITRPQFIMSVEGEDCDGNGFFGGAGGVSDAASSGSSSASSSGAVQKVIVEKELSVGAFDAKVISSDDAEALAQWLEDNNFNLSSQGSELLAPYIEAQSKFVVLKLKSNASVGSIQPIILKYQSDIPVIPMTLTAVAAEDDMGVLVWLLGAGRGVPLDEFKHVIPNYSVLDWFNSPRGTYLSYQNLITQAMNENGGQGFATDFAGYIPNLSEQLTTSESWTDLIVSAESTTDANFIALAWDELNAVVQSVIMSALPTSNAFVYQDPLDLSVVFTAAQLSDARALVLSVIKEQVIEPIDNSMDLLDDNLYLTRLYTTLSADEMTSNPKFSFNTMMPDQPLIRTAKMVFECINEHSGMSFILGEGTGRNGEVVMEIWDDYEGEMDGFRGQKSSWRAENTSATADPVIVDQNEFGTLSFGTKQKVEPEAKSGGVGTLFFGVMTLSLLFFRRRI